MLFSDDEILRFFDKVVIRDCVFFSCKACGCKFVSPNDCVSHFRAWHLPNGVYFRFYPSCKKSEPVCLAKGDCRFCACYYKKLKDFEGFVKKNLFGGIGYKKNGFF